MRNVVLAMRWIAVPTAGFFVFSLVTDIAREAALMALVFVGVAVMIVSVVDLAVRRR